MVGRSDGEFDVSSTDVVGKVFGLIFFVIIVAVFLFIFVVSPFFGVNVFEGLFEPPDYHDGIFDSFDDNPDVGSGPGGDGDVNVVDPPPVASCAPGTCSNHGTCTIIDWEVACICNDGYAGDDCSQCEPGYYPSNGSCVLVPVCIQNSCTGHGACSVVDNMLFCICGQGYSGSNCSSCAAGYHSSSGACVRDTVCVSDSCSGHGTCSVANNVVACSCSTGYTGSNCSQCSSGYSLQADGSCRQLILAACGNNTCETSENVDICPVDCFSMSPWNWPVSDSQLDAGNGLRLEVSVNPGYYEKSRNVLFQHQISVYSSLPSGFQLQYPDFARQVDPGFSVSDYNAVLHFQAFVNYYTTQNPNTRVGTYLSGRDCHLPGNTKGYPKEGFTCDQFLDSARIGNPYPDQPWRFRLNIHDSAVSQKFADLAGNEILSRRRPFVYIDNINHPSSGGLAGTQITLSDILSFLAKIKNRVNPKGIKVMANISVSPWGLASDNFADADALQGVLDGFGFEGPFHTVYARQYLGRVQDEINVYKRWLSNGKLVFFTPQTGGSAEDQLREKHFMAFMVMLFRQPGNAVWISRNFFEETSLYPWKDWPSQFGSPQGDFTAQTNNSSSDPRDVNWSMKRTFANGMLGVQHVSTRYNQPVGFSLAVPDNSTTPYELVKAPQYGQINSDWQVTWPQVTYTPNSDFNGTDFLLFGSLPQSGFYARQLMVVAYVPVSHCSDNKDNDADGGADANDPECSLGGVYDFRKDGESECSDKFDNDGDGTFDLSDLQCDNYADNSESN